ncbi:helix-turn-helix domain-containing protein [Ruminococcus callidus]|uniref:helix-turn-helix domain-containing protein n=1 Tax=Ruminococcus callidus TaxID=40519 RepID=UPI0035203E93
MNIENLKRARENAGLTQTQAAQKIGVSDGTYKNYEQGKREPNGDKIVTIANAFGVTTDYLLGRPDAKPPEEPLDEFARKEHLKSLEKVFMKKYLALTEEQRDKVLDFLRGVVAEETAAQASKLKMSRVYEAARSNDPNNAPHFAEYPEEELKKLDDDPDTDFDL